LILELQKYDETLPVVVNGYEGGVTKNFTLLEVNINVDVHKEWYYGESEVSDSKDAISVLCFQRDKSSTNRN